MTLALVLNQKIQKNVIVLTLHISHDGNTFQIELPQVMAYKESLFSISFTFNEFQYSLIRQPKLNNETGSFHSYVNISQKYSKNYQYETDF